MMTPAPNRPVVMGRATARGAWLWRDLRPPGRGLVLRGLDRSGRPSGEGASFLKRLPIEGNRRAAKSQAAERPVRGGLVLKGSVSYPRVTITASSG
jgi:hypothetical protein